MTNSYVRPGDKLKRNLRADTWNEFIAATERVQQAGHFGPEQFKPAYLDEDAALTALFSNDDTENAGLHAVRALTDPVILPSESVGDFEYRMQIKGEKPTDTDHGKFCITTEGIPTKSLGLAAISGCVSCKLKIPDNGGWIRWADVDPNNADQLLSTPSGTAQIIWKEAETETVNAIVRMGLPANRTHIGVVKSTQIDINSFGPVEIYDGPATATGYTLPEVYLDWMHGDEPVTQGKQVLITWFPDELKWRIVGAECEAGTGGAPIERGYEGP